MGDFGLNYKLNQFELVYFGLNWFETVSKRFQSVRNDRTGWENRFEPVLTGSESWTRSPSMFHIDHVSNHWTNNISGRWVTLNNFLNNIINNIFIKFIWIIFFIVIIHVRSF